MHAIMCIHVCENEYVSMLCQFRETLDCKPQKKKKLSVILKLVSLLTGRGADLLDYQRQRDRNEKEGIRFVSMSSTLYLLDLPLHCMALLGSDRMAAFHLCAVTLPSGPYYCTYHHLPVATETTLGGFLHYSVFIHLACLCVCFMSGFCCVCVTSDLKYLF